MGTESFSPNRATDRTATFTTNLSDEITLFGSDIMALFVPASFGDTSITFQAQAPDGSFYALKDHTNTVITITVDDTNAGMYDLSNVFPAGVDVIKLAATVTDNTEVEIITRPGI